MIDLAGLADLYIGRVGYQDRRAVEDYVFDEVKPDLLNTYMGRAAICATTLASRVTTNLPRKDRGARTG